jgi:single-stranded-DNA-specific exonuclease
MRSLANPSLVRHRNRWELPGISEEAIRQVQSELNVSAAMARLLAFKAGKGTPRSLLSHDISDLNSPLQLLGVEEAIARMELAIRQSEPIFIHGDFDVDGITSSALLYRALKDLGAKGQIKVEIEDRDRGHGLNEEVIKQIIDEGFSLVITTDCGVSDHQHIQTLLNHKIDAIITDHHHVPEQLPPAVAVINPKRPDCVYPNSDLAAVGVIYQTVSALYERMGRQSDEVRGFLDLVMLGTLGDLVPLVNEKSVENRIFVQSGLKMLADGWGCMGLRVLLEKLSLDPTQLTAGEMSFVVIPKLNAANRVGDPRVSFLLLTTSDREKADHLAETLLQYNYDRQVAQEDLREQAEERLREEVNLKEEKIIILAGRYWNPGVIGLVASDLADRYHRPAIMIAKGDEMARASGRSIQEFNMIESLVQHEHLFERYGGHYMAAGFSIRNDWIARLQSELGQYAREKLANLEAPVFSLEAEIFPHEVSLDLFDEIQRLGPFGVGNREPRFLLRNVRIENMRLVGNGGRHLKLMALVNGSSFDAIGFSLGDSLADIRNAQQVDLVVKLSRDDWNRQPKIQLELIDVLRSNESN